MTNYSQNNEQEIILNYFGSEKGRFVEIGAYDPFVFSNTRALFENGWDGVYIEANEKHLNKFKGIYQNNPEIECIYGALSVTADPIEFWQTDDAVSTTLLSHKLKWEKSGVPFTKTTVPAFTIDELVQKTAGFDFLTLDTEGTSFELFSFMPDDYLQSLRLICIEHDSRMKEINHRLSGLGFKHLYTSGENLIYGK